MNLFQKLSTLYHLLSTHFLHSQKGLAPLVIIIAVALIAAAVPTTVILVQQEQDNRQLAQTSIDCSKYKDDVAECVRHKDNCVWKSSDSLSVFGDCTNKSTCKGSTIYQGDKFIKDCFNNLPPKVCIETNGRAECVTPTPITTEGAGNICKGTAIYQGDKVIKDCFNEGKVCSNNNGNAACVDAQKCRGTAIYEGDKFIRDCNNNFPPKVCKETNGQAECVTPTPITDGGKPLCKEYQDDLGIYHSECKSECDGAAGDSDMPSYTCNDDNKVCCLVKVLSDAEKPPTGGSDPTTCEGKYGNGEYACYASGHCRSEGGRFLPGTGTECASSGGCCKFPKGNNGTTPAPPKSSPTTAPIPILVPEKGGWCADGNRQNAKPYPKDTKCNINNSPYNNNKYDAFCHKTFGSPSDFYFECPAANTPIVPGYCTNAAATSNPISINNPTCGLANTDYDSNYDAYCRENYGKNDNQSNYFYKCVAAVDKKPPADRCTADLDRIPVGCPCKGTGSSRCGILGNYTCMGPANDQPKDTEACCLVNQRACNDGRCVGQAEDFICGSGTPPTKTPTQTPVQQDTAVSCLGENPDALTFTKNGLSESLQDRNCTDAKVKSSSSRCCMGNGKCLSDFGGEFTCKTLQNDRGGPFGNCSTLPLCNN